MRIGGEQVVICITGMHRSGTSLVASWLESCGLPIHDGDVLESTPANPRGHFEDKDFVDLQTSAICQHRPKSRGWKIFPNSFLTFDEKQLGYAYQLVSKRNAKYGIWGWKDPRSVLFLTQWKSILPELKVLLVWRPCLEVVASITRRWQKTKKPTAKVAFHEAVKLWVYYNQRVCEYRQKYPDDTLLLPMDYVIRQDRTALDLINKRFCAGLSYFPIANLYNPNILHRESVSVPFLVRLANFYYRSSKVEKRLRELSDR